MRIQITFLKLGLSSLVIMKLVNQWRKAGELKISFGVLMEHPTLREWWELIQKDPGEKLIVKKRTAKKEKKN